MPCVIHIHTILKARVPECTSGTHKYCALVIYPKLNPVAIELAIKTLNSARRPALSLPTGCLISVFMPLNVNAKEVL